MDFFRQLFLSGDFQPHGFCYRWNSGLVWLNVLSDALIALAYFTIPFTLLWFIRKRRDLPFSWMFALFGVFIIACGTTHVMEVWNLWHAQYWLAGIIKANTALASVLTAILLVQLVPKALALPSPDRFKEVNQHLVDRTEELWRANAGLASANKALQHFQEQQRLLFDNIPYPVWVYESYTLAIKDVNQSAIRSYGYSREEFLSLTIKDLRPAEDIPALLENGKNAPEGAETRGSWKHRKKNGALIDVEITTGTVVFEGRDARLVVATDITERKKAEAESLRGNAELKLVNQELEAFSYSVSHDLRAPLRSIDGFSLALLEDYEEKLDAGGKDSLHRVRAATQRMGILIDDLLNLSRVARTEMKLQRVDLSAMGRSIAADLKITQPERRSEFKVQEDLDAYADSHLMSIALQNLIGNAWKFTSKRESACIEFGKIQRNGSLTYFVRDNGAGFDPAHAERLFGAFQRLHDANDFPGTGVGLATVQRIIHRHGGRIWAESAVERGATFYFTLDARPGGPDS
jgi:PAS domain S-box-containing protein